MKKILVLSSMVGLPGVIGLMQAMPAATFILLFSLAPAGIFATIFPGLTIANVISLVTSSTFFGYFTTGFFPTSGGIPNFILGL